MSYKIGSTTEQLTEGEKNVRDLQGKLKCLKILHGGETLYEASSRRLGPAKSLKCNLAAFNF